MAKRHSDEDDASDLGAILDPDPLTADAVVELVERDQGSRTLTSMTIGYERRLERTLVDTATRKGWSSPRLTRMKPDKLDLELPGERPRR